MLGKMHTRLKKAAILGVGLSLLACLALGEIRSEMTAAGFAKLLGSRDLDTIPATLTGSVDVQAADVQLAGLASSLQQIAQDYGMTAKLGRFDEKFGNIQIYCKQNFVAIATTSTNGELIMFQTMRYGFRTSDDYKVFNEQLITVLSRYGNVRNVRTTPPLPEKDLLARGDYMKLDVRSKCSRNGVKLR